MLIVDDEPSVAESTAAILEAEGFDVAVVATVEEALGVLGTRRVKSIILDHHLSGGNGERFLDRHGHALPPVILVSGLGSDALAEVQATRGDQLVVAYLTKPVPPLLLLETVRSVLRNE